MQPENIEILPYLIDDLSVIHSAGDISATCDNPPTTGGHSDNFNRRSHSNQSYFSPDIESSSEFRSGETIDGEEAYVKVPTTDALENTWVGDGIPIGASKAEISSFENKLEQEPTDGNIDIAVIVNDEQMSKEGILVGEFFNTREKLPLTTELQHQLTVEELRDILDEEYDFLHYIGHIDESGFRCTDGQLDATKLNSVSVRTFLLNACTSYQQAIGLIESGAVAGIATTEPILNSGAERIGKAIARLLNLGFPLISALNIARSESIMGENYIVIGDGSVNLTQAKSGIPSLCQVYPVEDGLRMIYNTFLTNRKDIGTITMPYAKNNNKYFLTSGETGEFELDKNELLRFISMGEMPIKMGSSLYWGGENEFIKQLE
jgi:hypothetical protein